MGAEGATIGEFAVGSLVANDGIWEEYLASGATDPSIRGKVRLLRSGAKDAEPTALMEALIAAREIDHPGVQKILEVFEHDGAPGFAYEIEAGVPLAEKIAQRSLTDGQIPGILSQLAHGLAAIHRAGIRCAALDPAGIVVSNGSATILVASVVGGVSAEGIPDDPLRYRAPEAVGSGERSERADIYALGRIAYDLYTSVAYRADRIPEDGDPIPLTLIDPIFSRDIAHIIETASAVDEERRQDSVEEIAAQFDAAFQNYALSAAPGKGSDSAPERIPSYSEAPAEAPRISWRDLTRYLFGGTPGAVASIGILMIVLGFSRSIFEPKVELLAGLPEGTYQGKITGLFPDSRSQPIAVLSAEGRRIFLVAAEGCAAEPLVDGEPYGCSGAALLFDVDSVDESTASGTVRFEPDNGNEGTWSITRDDPDEAVTDCAAETGAAAASWIPKGKKRSSTLIDLQKEAEREVQSHSLNRESAEPEPLSLDDQEDAPEAVSRVFEEEAAE